MNTRQIEKNDEEHSKPYVTHHFFQSNTVVIRVIAFAANWGMIYPD